MKEVFYRVDYGEWYGIMGEKTLHNLYREMIDKEEYPDYEGWLWDMKRCGLVTEM